MSYRDRTIGRGLALLGFLFLIAPACYATKDDDLALLRKTSRALTNIATQAMPAVVFIRVEKTVTAGAAPGQFFFNDPFEFFGDDFLQRFFPGFRPPDNAPQPNRPPSQRFMQMGQGSGFIISKDGYILTNNHVVGDADKITVVMNDGTEYTATRIGSDAKSEVALIKIEGKDFPYLELGDSSKLEIGEWVMAIGTPFGLAETVTTGIVSAKGRSGVGIADYENFIQTDAAINPGNSGGPLLNIEGKAIGINTAIYTRSGGYMGIGFAIPIDMAKSIMAQLKDKGKVSRGYLGIYIQDVTKDLAPSFGLNEASGVIVSDVKKDSAAEKAGLKQGDVILSLNGKKIANGNDFRNDVAATQPGKKITLAIKRDGKVKELTATTDALPGDESSASPAPAETPVKLGMTVEDLTSDLAQQFGYKESKGVVITQVDTGSDAWRNGLQPGQLITAVNRVSVSDGKEFWGEVAKASKAKAKSILLMVKAGEGARFVLLKLE